MLNTTNQTKKNKQQGNNLNNKPQANQVINNPPTTKSPSQKQTKQSIN